MKGRLFLRFIGLMVVVLSVTSVVTSCSKDDDEGPGSSSNRNANDSSQEAALARLEFPKVKGGNSVVLIHKTIPAYSDGVNYSSEWDCDKKSQRWTCYQLNKSLLQSNTSRYTSSTDQYPFDPLLSSQYLSRDLIKGSGFDHGHICPSADRLYSAEINKQTFYLTNMQPQYKAFNGSFSGNEAFKNSWSPWYQLEDQVRTWARATTTEMLYVVKGGTIESDQLLMTKDELLVPKYFFVALLLKNAQGYKAVGFWMEHKSSYGSKLPYVDCAVNIRTLEQKTGIDFFCNLPDNIEEKVETLPIENVKRAWF